MRNAVMQGPLPARTDRPSEAALRVLRALAGHAEPVTGGELTAELGGHPNSVRPHLERLVRSGLIAVIGRHGQGRGRPARAYRATISGLQVAEQDPGAATTAALLGAVADHLRDAPAPAEAARALGRAWGRRLRRGPAHRDPAGRDSARRDPDHPDPDSNGRVSAPRDPAHHDSAPRDLVEVLAAQGFAPEQVPGGVALRTCPMLEHAVDDPDVVCSLHQGVIDELAPEPVRLIPFAGPGYCLIARGPASSPASGVRV